MALGNQVFAVIDHLSENKKYSRAGELFLIALEKLGKEND